MEVEYDSDDLDRLETDQEFTGGWPAEIVKAFRKRIQIIRAAKDERDLYALRSNKFEKLKGNRSHEHSIRVTIQYRLILEIKRSGSDKVLLIKKIEDYH